MIDWASKLKEATEERRLDQTRYYLILSGDRDFSMDDTIYRVVNGLCTLVTLDSYIPNIVDKLIAKKVGEGLSIKVVHGDSHGSDDMAHNYTVSRDYDDYIFEADWNTHGKKAGFIRNEDLFSFVGKRPNKGCILMWNGEDTITLHMIWLSYVYNINIKVFNYKIGRWYTAEEITQLQESEHNKRASFYR